MFETPDFLPMLFYGRSCSDLLHFFSTLSIELSMPLVSKLGENFDEKTKKNRKKHFFIRLFGIHCFLCNQPTNQPTNQLIYQPPPT